MTNSSPHISVMLEQALELLALQPGKTWVDATAGAGGHLREIIRRTSPGGKVIAIDRDSNSLGKLASNLESEGLSSNCTFVHANFADISQSLFEHGINTISGGIFADLGVSSMQLDEPERGFSFSKDGPLDMRMDPTALRTAADLVNNLSEKELADIIYKFGEERLSRPIAHRIVESRPLRTTSELSSIVSRVVDRYRKGKRSKDESHPATRTFQALRMAVNDELGSLEKFLRSSIQLLSNGGRLVVITFHSLEDRLVKQIFREAAASCLCPPRQPICTCAKRSEIRIVTPKPLLPETQEVLANPRSRSAKLRAGEKM